MRCFLTILSLAAFALPAHAEPLEPGDPAPTLEPAAWVDQAPEGVDLLLFVGSWCPLSRIMLDELSADPSLRIAAISSEPRWALEDFVQVGGWEGLALGSDPDRALWEAWLGEPLLGKPLPYAFVLGAEDLVLWKGPALDAEADDPLAELRGVLDDVRAGTFDLDQARAHVAQRARVEVLIETLPGDARLLRVRRHAAELAGAPLAGDQLQRAASVLNQVAWRLATAEDRGAAELELGLELVERSLALRPDDPASLDTQAALLWQLERQDEAFELQLRAVELAHGTSMESQLRPALEEYAASLGRSLGPAADDAPGQPWSGVINQAFRRGEPVLLVRPATMDDPEAEASWAGAMEGVRAMFARKASPEDPPIALHLPDAVTAEAQAASVPVLYGSPGSNPLVAEVLAYHGLVLEPEGLRVGERLLAAPEPFLIAALPSPWQPSLPVVIYTGIHGPGALDLNTIFHGPTGLVLGSNGPDGARTKVLAVDPVLEDGRVVGLRLGPATLTGAELAADLEALHGLLAREYAGWSDLQWSLRAAGTDWTARTEEHLQRAEAQETWSFGEAYDLLLDYLEPVQDTHFYIEGVGLGPDGAVERKDRLVDSLVPWFADGVVGEGAHDLAVLPEPVAAVPGQPYLFPTLAQDDHDPAFLVGVLADPQTPPEQLSLPTGKSLAVHRGRARSEGRGSWSLSVPPDSPLPVLSVRTMNRSQLDGLAETAVGLRAEPGLVLDLRGNGGGSDTPAHDWVTRFSRESYRRACGAQVVKDQDAPLRHWRSWSDSGYMVSGGEYPTEPYDGRLAVLIDTGVASSGETFAFLASTVQGALLLGENSSGCSAYGNVESHEPLPHSGVSLRFGRSRFVWECTRPVVEGVGMFPDFWLDVEDPVGWLAEHPEVWGGEGSAGGGG